MDRKTIIDALNAANEKIKNYLGIETYWFSKEEIAQLQPLFEDKIDFAKALWVHTKKSDEDFAYWGENESGSRFHALSCEQMMKQLEILNKVVENCVLFVDKVEHIETEHELYQTAIEQMNKFIARKIEDTQDARMEDTERMHKRCLDSVLSIENGKLVKENGENYTCIICRYKSDKSYKSKLTLRKEDDGIHYDYCRPLAGHCIGVAPTCRILSVLRHAMLYMV